MYLFCAYFFSICLYAGNKKRKIRDTILDCFIICSPANLTVKKELNIIFHTSMVRLLHIRYKIVQNKQIFFKKKKIPSMVKIVFYCVIFHLPFFNSELHCSQHFHIRWWQNICIYHTSLNYLSIPYLMTVIVLVSNLCLNISLHHAVSALIH